MYSQTPSISGHSLTTTFKIDRKYSKVGIMYVLSCILHVLILNSESSYTKTNASTSLVNKLYDHVYTFL